MPTADEVRETIDAYRKAFEAGDREAWLDLFADDCEHVDPVPGEPNRTREARGLFWDNVHGMADRFEFDVKDLVVCGDEAVLTFTMNARSGDAGMQIDIVDVFRVNDDGRIASLRAYWDPARMRPMA